MTHDRTKLSVIYAIESFPDVYVGVTANSVDDRAVNHADRDTPAAPLLARDHEIRVIECDIEWDDRTRTEALWMDEYRSTGWTVVSRSAHEAAVVAYEAGGGWKNIWLAKTSAERSAIVARGWSKLSPEQRSERVRRGWRSMSPDERSERGRHRALSQTLEQRQEHASNAGKIGSQTTNAQRYKCNECELVTNAGALGRHQKSTGHRGRLRVL